MGTFHGRARTKPDICDRIHIQREPRREQSKVVDKVDRRHSLLEFEYGVLGLVRVMVLLEEEGLEWTGDISALVDEYAVEVDGAIQ